MINDVVLLFEPKSVLWVQSVVDRFETGINLMCVCRCC